MAAPRLTFFCELEAEALQALLEDALIADLTALKASVSLGLVDLSERRAGVVRRLNQAGIPVVAWLLLPRQQGYWFCLDNAPQAAHRYRLFQEWTTRHGLQWDAVGLDIETHIGDLETLVRERWRVLPRLVQRIFDRKRLVTGRAAYRALVRRIRHDGYRVDSYVFPFIVDERMVESNLLQRITGWVDLDVDREVLMLYSSFYRPYGAGLLHSYARRAQSVGLGSTGGGVESSFPEPPPLSWDELRRDLLLAWYWCEDLHIFGLEGCVEQAFLERLKSFTWDQPILLPEAVGQRVDGWRRLLRIVLWLSARLRAILLGMGIGILLVRGLRRKA